MFAQAFVVVLWSAGFVAVHTLFETAGGLAEMAGWLTNVLARSNDARFSNGGSYENDINVLLCHIHHHAALLLSGAVVVCD